MSTRASRWVAAAVAALLFAATSTVLADARSSYLVRLLRTSSQFRVRAQAALSLGGVQSDPSVVRALAEALRDDHPAVRASAASSLERLADPSALSALRARENDGEPAVRSAVRRAIRRLDRMARSQPRQTPLPRESHPSRSGGDRYYIGIATPGARAVRLDRNRLAQTRQFIVDRISEIDGVIVAPERESNGEARRVLNQRGLAGYYIDSSIVRVEERGAGALRAEVSVIVGTYPGRDIRVMLQGAATVSGVGSGEAAKQAAIESAFNGALRRLPQALEASDSRRAQAP